MTATATTENPFGDEFEPPEGSQDGSNKIEYDRWGRYANLPAIPGVRGVGPWTRVSTVAKTLDDPYFLDLWKQRQIIRGIHKNPDLLRVLNGSRFDPDTQHGKKILNALATQAMEEVGSYDGATAGTKFHDLAEKHDLGEDWYHPDAPEDDRLMVEAYRNELARHAIRVVPELMERVICVPELNVAGRFDRVVLDNGVYRIGDLKSQKSMDFGHISLAVQLAIYANASYVLNMETWEWEPVPVEIDKSTGVIMWVPATQPGRAEIHDVDIAMGWTLAKASVRVREWRKEKGFVVRRARVA
jgi:hypothetical protein